MKCIYCNSELTQECEDTKTTDFNIKILECTNCPKDVVYTIKNETICDITIRPKYEFRNNRQYYYAYIVINSNVNPKHIFFTTIVYVQSLYKYEILLSINDDIINPYNFDSKIQSIKTFM